MTARVSSDWSYHGLRALVLENNHMRVVVLPELGGKVWQITGTRNNREFLWHNDRLQPRKVPFGTGYDDSFFGGWDELFPNDAPEDLAGEPYPDHGELWTSPWSWSVEQEGPEVVSVRLTLRTPISGCLLEKTLTLNSGQPSLTLSHRIENTLPKALPFLWKQHVAVPVDEPARVDLAPASMYVEDFGTPRAGGPGTTYTWPTLIDESGHATDMSRTLPRSSGVSEFQYATELSAGWCSVTYGDGTGLGLVFDANVFRSCWLFASYGGWRGLQALVLEPCTGYPVEVSVGADAGTHQTLAPGQVITTSITAVVYDGMSEIHAVHPDGRVEGVRGPEALPSTDIDRPAGETTATAPAMSVPVTRVPATSVPAEVVPAEVVPGKEGASA